MRVCIVQPRLNAVSETFIRAHAERLPADITVVHRDGQIPMIGDRAALSQSTSSRALRKMERFVTGRGWDWEITSGFLKAIRKSRADVVLAEYGPTGVEVMSACELADVPFVVHFHGFDASIRAVLSENRDTYREMFTKAAGIVAVSSVMKKRLLEIGADPQRLHLNVYGIDCQRFDGASPREAPPTFLAVGRFVEKKAPYLTILAFAHVVNRFANAKLRMIGDGPLLGPCKDLTRALGISNAVTFLGSRPQEVVAREMRHARAFVQHSVEAENGDCEGTPLAVMEAGATGLPVVSTRHGGIPDVVIDGETGFLVNERDVLGMAERMLRLAVEADLAGQFGISARKRISTEFTTQRSIAYLYEILRYAAERKHHNERFRSASVTANSPHCL